MEGAKTWPFIFSVFHSFLPMSPGKPSAVVFSAGSRTAPSASVCLTAGAFWWDSSATPCPAKQADRVQQQMSSLGEQSAQRPLPGVSLPVPTGCTCHHASETPRTNFLNQPFRTSTEAPSGCCNSRVKGGWPAGFSWGPMCLPGSDKHFPLRNQVWRERESHWKKFQGDNSIHESHAGPAPHSLTDTAVHRLPSDEH